MMANELAQPMELDKDIFQKVMLRAGLSPRDLADILTCYYTTLYGFFKRGTAKRVNLFSFHRIQDFLFAAVGANVFPIIPTTLKAKKRKDLVYRAYTHWSTLGNFDTFDPKLSE
jgi:hypothetical protein